MDNRYTHNDPIPEPGEETLRRFVGGVGEQVFNRDLLCARCANLMEEAVAECEIYEQKPLAVLRGGDACPEYVPMDATTED